MPLRLARYSALSVKYQVIVVMCCRPRAGLGEHGHDVLQRLPDLADEIVGLEALLCPVQPTCPPTKTSRPRAATPLA